MSNLWIKFLAMLNSIGKDKLYHFIAGLLISAFFAISLKMEVCVVPAVFAGFFKEFADQWCGGKFDWLDLLAVGIGGAVIQLFVMI